MKGGTYTGIEKSIDNYKTMTMKGGTIYGQINQKSGTFNMKGGKIISSYGTFIQPKGNINISKGTVKVNGKKEYDNINSIFQMTNENCKINISGGTFEVNYGSVIGGGVGEDGDLNISNGTFKVSDPKKYYVIDWDGYYKSIVNISGGVFNGYVNIQDVDSGTISGGSFYLSKFTEGLHMNSIDSCIKITGSNLK